MRIVATVLVLAAMAPAALGGEAEEPIALGSRRELFADRFLIDRLDGAELRLHPPTLAPPSPKPRPAGHYATVLKDGDTYRFYCRGHAKAGIQGRESKWEATHAGELTLYAESKDGIRWTTPDLGLYDLEGHPAGNVVLADAFLVNHNFTPFIDERPGIPADERFKAIGGLTYGDRDDLRAKHGPGGLYAFASPDGIHWRRLRDKPIIPEGWGKFDSQNVAFWSALEKKYVCYFRTFVKGFRSIRRTTSKDFLHWSDPVPMNANLPGEHLYTNGTHPYFRAPHIYVALPTRFMPDRGNSTDILFMTARGPGPYDRTFKEAFIRPGLGAGRWANRANYAAWHVVPTGPAEMSIYVTGGLRYVLRVDGFASVHAGYEPGEMVTRPLTFTGTRLEMNFATSAAGGVEVEIQDAAGRAVPGFALDDCPPIYGDAIDRVVSWKGKEDVSGLAGRPVRLRFRLRDADVYAIRFR